MLDRYKYIINHRATLLRELPEYFIRIIEEKTYDIQAKGVPLFDILEILHFVDKLSHREENLIC